MGNSKEYRTTVYAGTMNGRAVRKTVRANSQRELNKKVAEIKASVSAGKDVYSRALFGEWANKWLNETKVPSGISKGTITQYESAIKHINNYFEYVELKQINLSDFQTMINELSNNNPNTNKPMSKKSLENIKKVASSVFGYACSNNIDGVPNFFNNVMIPKNAPSLKRRALTETEQEWIINTPHRAQLPAMIMMFAGLRRGEVIPLKWSDIDFKKGCISVTKSVEYKSNKPTIKQGGKSNSAVRVIPIPPILINYLNEYKNNTTTLSMYICLNAQGNIHTKSSWCKMWQSYLNELNVKYGYSNKVISKHNPKYKSDVLPMRIENITPHYLRHTFATILYLEKVNVVTAKQILGHSDIQTTVNIYTDLEHNSIFSLSDTYKNKLEQAYKIDVA